MLRVVMKTLFEMVKLLFVLNADADSMSRKSILLPWAFQSELHVEGRLIVAATANSQP